MEYFYEQFLKLYPEEDMTPYYSKYFNDDILENMLIRSDMQEVENLCNTNKNIKSFCENKRIWKFLIERDNIVLFENINQIHTFSEFIDSYKRHKYYEARARQAINRAKNYDNIIYFNVMEISEMIRNELFEFLFEKISENINWSEYGTAPIIPENILLIFFNVETNKITYLFSGNMSRTASMSQLQMFNIIVDILYWFKTVVTLDVKKYSRGIGKMYGDVFYDHPFDFIIQ